MKREKRQYLVETYEGVIEYGEYSGDYWYGIGGPTNAIWRRVQERIIAEAEAGPFSVFVLGGLLEDWVTWDGDIFLIGPYQPKNIKRILDTIIRIGFEEHFYLDATYQDKLWPIHKSHKWIKDEPYHVSEISNHFSKDGKKKDTQDYEYRDGLYHRTQYLPYNKHWANKLKGYRYKKPIQLI